MMTARKNKVGGIYIITLCYQALLILFFSYTLANKVANYADFELNLQKTGLYPVGLLRPIAIATLVAEAGAIALLIWKTAYGYRFVLLLISLFTGYICFLQIVGRYEVCGCGGILNGLTFPIHLGINIALLVSLSIVLVYEKDI
jgi:hypothetical protein